MHLNNKRDHGVNHAHIWEKDTQSRANSQGKGPKTGYFWYIQTRAMRPLCLEQRDQFDSFKWKASGEISGRKIVDLSYVLKDH